MDSEKKNKVYMEHQQHKKSNTYKSATYVLGVVAVVLAILFIVSLVTKGFSSGAALSEDQVKEKTVTYLNGLLAGQGTVTVDSISDEGDLYSMKLNIGGQPYNSYVRKDGSFLFPSGIDMSVPPAAQGGQQTQPEDIPKTDKPEVELFVMSHCPYGTQAEKGILPAVRTLGDKVDFKVKFVYYAMHGQKEVDEQLNQYCIQKEQPDVFLKYLACFLNASDSEGCLTSTGVDRTRMAACTAAADEEFGITASFNDRASWLSGQFPLFNTDKEANQKYGVGGSPTLVINGVQSSAGRDPASYLSAICSSFNNAPAECETELSAVASGPGFGYDSTASAAAAGCGI